MDKDEKAPDTTLSTSKEKLADIILTEEEKAQVENGTDIKFILGVKDAGDTVSNGDKGCGQRPRGEIVPLVFVEYTNFLMMNIHKYDMIDL